MADIKTVAVALSGGVDSSVCAHLLKEQGYNVIAVTGFTTDESVEIIENAKSVAASLGIKHYVVDVRANFKTRIIDYFKDSYKNGETPNPCAVCNQFIKWGQIFDFAINELKADFFATGHYADIKYIDGSHKLYPAKDIQKDQLYFLFTLTQEQLSKTMFPLANLEKTEIRKIAVDNNLPSKSSKDSQDICFIKKPMTTKKYLLENLEPKKGDFIDCVSGKKLGVHDGYFQYTIGQRKGIGIAAPYPLYVTNIDSRNNVVYLGQVEDTYTKTLVLNSFNFSYNIDDKLKEFDAMVKIRYNMKPQKAHIVRATDGIEINFYEKINSVTKGQACVLYDINDGHLIGGSFI